MKVWKIGCGVTLLGVLLTLGSCGLFGLAFNRQLEQRQILARDLDPLQLPATVEFAVDEESRVRIDILAAVTPADSDLAAADSASTIVSTRLNFEYRVRSESGEVLARGAGSATGSEIIPDAARREGSPFGDRIDLRAQGEPFDVAGPASCLVEVDLARQDDAGRPLEGAGLQVFDRVGRNAGGLAAGGLLSMLLGPMVSAAGVLVLMIGLMTGRRSDQNA